MPERPGDHVNQIAEGDVLDIDRHGPRLDLRQIENVADQVQQVGAGAVDRPGKLDLLRCQVAVGVVGHLLA